MRRLFTPLLLLLIAVSSPSVAETIYIYSYHNHPPFVTKPGQGLTYKLADILRQQSGNQFDFKVKILPRPRLNAKIKHWIAGQCEKQSCAQDWLVPWVNPRWGFIKGPRDNYLWHELYAGSSSVLSHIDNPVDYQGPDSLQGKTFAGMRGHRYLGIDPLVSEGKIRRLDGNKERDNLMKILMKRVDATILPTSTINYFLRYDAVIKAESEKLLISDIKHQQFSRYIMLPETRPDLLRLVTQAKQSTAKLLDAYR
ncbi:type 2 periplasmic-binding domain-containing protein [Marinobacterium jannaschii]|uniref:hypothetical protein n=1 Tax=Marinobacterium jannaschii TaxID=64970 RepID=UPI000482D1B6|nr:hypothetical protein [Marinobacterium jannaschii]